MNKRRLNITIGSLIIIFLSAACSNKKNTFISRQYHALTTHYNVFFNGRESLKEGKKKIEEGIVYNYNMLLPVFEYQDSTARALASMDIENAVDKATKAIKLHSITRKPKRRRGKQTKEYKEFRKKPEFNNKIEDCYLLLGKALFYKEEYRRAEKALEQGLNDFPQSDMEPEFLVELARCQIAKKNYTRTATLLGKANSFPLSKKMKQEVAALYADMNIKEGNYQAATSHLKTAIQLQSKKQVKARYYYILGQLYIELGQANNASQAFANLIKMHSAYEMVFNAKISKAFTYVGAGNGSEIRKELYSMLKDSKNREYKDQIYFALAEMDIIDGDKNSAIKNYWKSVRESIVNDNQKAISFMKLGDNYFADTNYKKAQSCYDSSMIYLDHKYPNYNTILSRVESLTSLVKNLNIIEREDSLQSVARMSKNQRESLISNLINKEVEEEQAKKAEEAENRADKAFYRQNRMIDNYQSNNRNQNQGNWYFYNPTTVGLGRSEFQRKWGKRKLSDYWRRKNKSISTAENLSVETENTNESTRKNKGNKKNKTYYLSNIPLTEDAIAKSNLLIMNALHDASYVYSEQLDDKAKAIETMETLLKRFPNNPHVLSAYYQCYSLYLETNNFSKSEYYKNKILTDFPDTHHAKSIKNPNYWASVENQNRNAENLYLKAYDAFQNFYYERVIQICNQGLDTYPEANLKSNFLFLKALSIGRTQDVAYFKNALNEVLNSTPNDDIKEASNEILNALNTGSVPVRYSQEDMTKARQNRLLINWRIEDQLALEMENGETYNMESNHFEFTPDEAHYFALVFKRKAADLNMTLFNIDRYNRATNSKKLKAEYLSLNKSEVVILVKGLENKDEALDYFNKVIVSKDAYKGLESVPYKNFVISASNFDAMKKEDLVDEYLNFYKRYYSQNKTGLIKQGDELVYADGGNSIFNLDFSDNHHFILLLPISKVDLTKVVNDISNHNKKYEVLKQRYGHWHDMLIVTDLGERNSAMKYFNEIIKSNKIFAPLDQVDYKSFIIGEKNFTEFFMNRRLEEYLDFFNRNYMK